MIHKGWRPRRRRSRTRRRPSTTTSCRRGSSRSDFGATHATIRRGHAGSRRTGPDGRPDPRRRDCRCRSRARRRRCRAPSRRPIDRYRLSSGKTGLHNRSVPEVPATIAPAIEGVIGLDTLSPPQPTTSPPKAAPAGAADRAAASEGVSRAGAGAAGPGRRGIARRASTRLRRHTGRSTPSTWPRRTRSTPSTTRATTGRERQSRSWSCRERASARRTSISSPTATASPSGNGQVSEVDMDGGGATGPNTVEAESGHRDRALAGPAGQHRGLRGWRLGQDLQRLEQDRQRRLREDRERELDQRVRVLRGAVAAELGEHAAAGGGRRRTVRLRLHR